MLKLHSQIMVCNCQNCQSFIVYVIFPSKIPHLRQKVGQKLVLKQDNGKHGMLESIFMAIQLTKHCTEIQMCICKSCRLVQFKLKFKSLDQIRKGSSNFASPSVVACQIIISRRLELQGIPCDQFRLFQIVEGQLKFLLVEMHHGCLIEVLAQLLGGSLKFRVVNSINTLLDANYFLHDVDAFYKFALYDVRSTFFCRISHLDVSCVNFQRSKTSICDVIKLYMQQTVSLCLKIAKLSQLIIYLTPKTIGSLLCKSFPLKKQYYNLFNVKMEKSFFQSQDADAKSMFDETFGRGCAIKYRQPAFSERNKFQLQRLNLQAKQRQGESFIYMDESKDRNNLHSSKEFDKIDQINSKIHGLIKSISASCHKKMPLGFKKEINKNKQSHPEPEQRSLCKARHLDEQKTQKKKSVQVSQSLLQSKLFQGFVPEGKLSKNTLQAFDRHFNESQQQAYQKELDGRIKKINDKINNYQNKIKYNHSKEVKSSHASISIKKEIGLKQYKDHSNLYNLTPKKIDNATAPKIEPNKGKYIMNQKQNDFEKKGLNEKSFMKMDPDKKLTYFRDKYANPQNRKHANLQHKQAKKQSKPTMKSPLINKELLSYKTAFIKQLVHQIALDQDFRHAKHMFGGIQGLTQQEATTNNSRWNKLQKQLKNEGFNLPISEVKDIFMPRDDQIDPFMSVSHSHEELVHGVIQTYRACQKNWNQKIYHSWSVWQLNQSKFTGQHLDQGRKGYITLQDLTFYLNTELDGSYRNRDLLLIFNRLKGTRKGKQDEQAIRYRYILDKLISA